MTEKFAYDPRAKAHLAVLDGWRGLSIIMVLAGHMLPIGPKAYFLNEAVAAAGMAIFFVLSGFLITTTLLRDQTVVTFLIKRLFRIVPLAWTFIAFVLIAPGRPMDIVVANLFFYANLSQYYLRYAPHFWSLSIEMQFYMFIALIVSVFRRKGLYLLPLCGIAITAARVWRGTTVGVTTFDRVDEILAGAMLALLLSGRKPVALGKASGAASALLIALLLAGTQQYVRHTVPLLAYLRPYFAAGLVGLSFGYPHSGYRRVLESKILRYFATISYALYVVHPITYAGWLGSGDRTERYLKRPLSFLITFVIAHLSTRYLERPSTDFGHRLAARYKASRISNASA